jgi:release factor glutamine methyltransferase
MNPVYEPREDSYILQNHIGEYAKGSVLDMGTGSGILALEAAITAGKVVAVDINKKAITYCKKAHKAGNLFFKESNLFSALKGKRFNLIIFNPPYLPSDPRIKDIALNGGRHGYEVIQSFLSKAGKYLRSGGRILLLFSSLSKKSMVDGFIDRNGFTSQQIDSQKLDFEVLYVYVLTKSLLVSNMESLGIRNIRFLAQGHRGIIYTGSWKGNTIAIKGENPESAAINRMKHEAAMLKTLNKQGIGPHLLYAGDRFFIYRFVSGTFIEDYIESHKAAMIRKILSKVLEQLALLDKLGIRKSEMTHPPKHIIVQKNAKPVLIDFERARYTSKPDNVTQFCQYLIHLRPMLKKKGIDIDQDTLVTAARAYSKSKDPAIVRRLLA